MTEKHTPESIAASIDAINTITNKMKELTQNVKQIDPKNISGNHELMLATSVKDILHVLDNTAHGVMEQRKDHLRKALGL